MLASLRSGDGRHDRNTWTISLEYAGLEVEDLRQSLGGKLAVGKRPPQKKPLAPLFTWCILYLDHYTAM